MDLSIIIVNWNSGDYAVKCLASIYASPCDFDFEVVIVDNASSDDSRQVIQQHFPFVKLIRSSTNLGFPRANNLGVVHSTGSNLLFLNPDTEVLGSALARLQSYLNSLPDVGVVGCRLLTSDLSLQTSCVQPFPTLLNQVTDIEQIK